MAEERGAGRGRRGRSHAKRPSVGDRILVGEEVTGLMAGREERGAQPARSQTRCGDGRPHRRPQDGSAGESHLGSWLPVKEEWVGKVCVEAGSGEHTYLSFES